MPRQDLRIETARLTLRLMEPTDLDSLLKIFGDPKVMKAFDEEPFTPEQMEHWLERNLQHQNEHGYGLFAVILNSAGILIGDCGLEHMEVDGEQIAELGYDFRSDYWNRGYATEAAATVRDFAFQELEIPHLISLIRVGNEASRRVAEKIGMELEAEINRYGIPYWKYGIQRVAHQMA